MFPAPSHHIDVLIPLAAAGRESGGMICEIRAGFTDRPATTTAGYDPTIRPLVDIKLGAAGQRALDTLRRLPLPRNGMRNRLRLTRPQSPRSQLTPLDTRQGKGLDTRNADSAELGLALALCALERGRETRVFFATGTLEAPADSVTPVQEGPVGAVDGLTQKFQAVATWIERHRVGPWNDRVTFFVPPVTVDGSPTVETHAHDIDELTTRAAVHGVKVRVTPLRSVSEGARILKAERPRLDRREVFARTGLGAAAVLAVLAVWAAQPLSLRPAEIDSLLGSATSPQIMTQSLISDGDQASYYALPMCRDKQDLPMVRFNDFISAEFETETTHWPAGRYHVLFAMIGEKSDPKVFTSDQIQDMETPVRKRDRRIAFGGSFLIEAPEEEMKLVALGRKVAPYDADGIHRDLIDVAKDASPETRLNTQALWLSQLRGAYDEISFVAVAPDAPGYQKCAEQG
ncbi:MAG: hypothetical protein AAGH83_00690 [Pseudomonadota bacterium]